MHKTNDTTNAGAATTAHPFELAGMGQGPYGFVGIVEMPNLSEDSASNFGKLNPYAEVQSWKLKAGAGTCACCGMAITVICVIRDGNGDRWGVGSNCAEKAGEPALCDAVKVAVSKRRNAMARDRREEKRAADHAKWLQKVCNDRGETNVQRISRENAERFAAAAILERKSAERAAILKPMSDTIRDGRNGFCDSIAADMERGMLPVGRGLDLAIEIYAKTFGRRNSNAFESANLEACKMIEAAQAI